MEVGAGYLWLLVPRVRGEECLGDDGGGVDVHTDVAVADAECYAASGPAVPGTALQHSSVEACSAHFQLVGCRVQD